MNREYDTIVLGDCLELFKAIPSNSVDITFADPPFNLKKKYKTYHDDRAVQEYLDWCEQWITEMVRVTKPSGSLFIHNIPQWLTFYAAYLNKSAYFKHWIVWDAPTVPMGKSLQPAHYGILFYTKSAKGAKIYELRRPHERERRSGYLRKDYGGKKSLLHPFGPLVSDVWTDIHRIRHKTRRDEHPCQLPVHLLERILLMASDAGDTVLDPFSGTGTTAVAAKQLGRRYLGFELDEQYRRLSVQKLEQTRAHRTLKDKWVSWFLDEIVTLREADWEIIKDCFCIPQDSRLVDKQKIRLNAVFARR
ncbi:MAG: site-specific DNA-methyltransferase [Spirochaetaceae bacterium]|jgi:site-specific DNA-methyltransferase (adenine-specific)|nr:site-specific DNA-methyltransferase [Spirochaetaceae bacterium]